ncbi:MAG: JAB domain-containing protein [Thermodesulfovibrionales bacterium]
MEIKEHNGKVTSSSKDIATIISAIIAAMSEHDQDKEHFYCIGLSVKNHIKYIDLASVGTLTNSLIHPREAFRLAITKGVASLIFAHNHPSGDPAPSREDITTTERLKKAGEILGIKTLDHVIVGNGNGEYISMLEKGYL